MILLPLLLFSLVLGELSKIQILKPLATDSWSQGASVWVMWDLKSVGDDGPDRIDLDLCAGPGDGVMLENISFGVPIGELAAEWTVKQNLPPGNDYFVKVSSPGTRGFKFVSERFTIARNNTKGQGNSATASHQGSSQLNVLVTLLVILLGLNSL